MAEKGMTLPLLTPTLAGAACDDLEYSDSYPTDLVLHVTILEST